MGFSFAGLRKELESTAFRALYKKLRTACPLLAPFADPCALIAFFHDREADYARKDRILHTLIGRYRQGGSYEALASFFLVLFAPAMAKINTRGRWLYSEIGDDDLNHEICLAFLETIRTVEIAPHKVAAQITGRVKNSIRGILRRRIQERRQARPGSREGPMQPSATGHRFMPDADEDFSAEEHSDAAAALWERLAGEAATDQSSEDEGPVLTSVTDVSALLDDLEQRKVINRADRELIETTVLDGFSLKDIASSPAEYQRLKKRRQRALSAIKKSLFQ
jgi:hypothetical protein